MLRFAVMSDPQGAAIVVFTPNPAMPLHNDLRLQRPEQLAGMNFTQPISKLDLASTTSSLAGPKSAIWTWARWASIASLMKATTNKWATAA